MQNVGSIIRTVWKEMIFMKMCFETTNCGQCPMLEKLSYDGDLYTSEMYTCRADQNILMNEEETNSIDMSCPFLEMDEVCDSCGIDI